MRLASLVIGAAALLLFAETCAACNPQLNFPDSCNAYDKSGNIIDGPGRSTRTETPTTATDAKVVSPGLDTTMMPAPPAPKTVPLRNDLSKSIQTLSPPSPPKPATTTAPVDKRYPPGFTGVTGFTGNPSTPTATSLPGGISLSRAAAQRMPLNFSIDGANVKNGRIVLSGQPASQGSIDAALFLTALRAACGPRDPYFSLDPDDMSLWQAETDRASEEFNAHLTKALGWQIKKNFNPKTPSILKFRTISARRDYPAQWTAIASKYPNLKSRLVFGPEWLRETRFGEILYQADVLLKELAGGAPTLHDASLRASKIDDYLSATTREAARNLLRQHHGQSNKSAVPVGGRIWYDLTESSETIVEKPSAFPDFRSPLAQMLAKRGLLPGTLAEPAQLSIARAGNALDLSQIFPKMYVRVRDPRTGRDGTGYFPGVNEMAAEANRAPQRYALAYREYEALVQVFRAYVVAVHVKSSDSRVCQTLPPRLLDSERVAAPLPQYHPAELTITAGWYEHSDGRTRRAIMASKGLFQGGVSVGVTRFLNNQPPIAITTPVLREMQAEALKSRDDSHWKVESGRHYVSLMLDGPAVISRGQAVPTPSAQGVVPAARTIARNPRTSTPDKLDRPTNASGQPQDLDDVVIENEPPPQPLPPMQRVKPFNR
jgi:hypothetical protein